MQPMALRKLTSSLVLSALLITFTAPAAFARHDRYCGGGPCYDRHRDHRHGYGKRHRHRGGDIAAGIIGGVVGLVVLDHLLNDRSRPHRAYAPPPPPPYGAGYHSGYREGYERARRDLYDSGRRSGYYDGYRDGTY